MVKQKKETQPKEISYSQVWWLFLKAGATAFGGWSSTALLLEKSLTSHGYTDSSVIVNQAVAYAQVLPGATQVAIVSNVGFRLKQWQGSVVATTAYLLPAISSIIIFSAYYFHYLQGSSVLAHVAGLRAVLAGIILANAYRLAQKKVVVTRLWAVVGLAFAAALFLRINALLIIIICGLLGCAVSVATAHKKSRNDS